MFKRLSTILSGSLILSAVLLAQTPPQTSSMSGGAPRIYELSNVTAMMVDGIRYSRPHARFVAMSVPNHTKMIIVSYAGGVITYGLPVSKLQKSIVDGTTLYAFPIKTDGQPDTLFTIHFNLMFNATPYVGPAKVSALPKRTCQELNMNCTVAKKTRAMRVD